MVIKRKVLLSGRRKAGDNWGSERQVPGRSKEVGGEKQPAHPRKEKQQISKQPAKEDVEEREKKG